MPFFAHPQLFPAETDFLQFLSQLDDSTSKPQHCQQQKQCVRRVPTERKETFTPRFDVTEVEGAYELFGELPGIEQKDVGIEFVDAQTLVIRGTTTRDVVTESKGKEPELETEKATSDTASEKSHTATVEDDYDEADAPLATPASTTTVAETEKPAQAPEQQTPKPKYWVSERRVGEFARSFSFSKRVDHDAVSATLKNGILHVVVPKNQKTGRVVVNLA
ncbi:putative 30 kDa heat shock protein [Halenospora varia]|nr:putative 30 kDa heat shock protein [Halenospora varia]